MIRNAKTLTTIIGLVYLCIGFVPFPALVMYVLYVPKNILASKPFVMHLATLILLYGPCFFIAYAWIRRRKWGWYLLIAYNGLWFVYMSYAFVARMINYSEQHLDLVIAGFLIPLVVLGSLVALAFEKDVKASMSH